ncbi:hypothetical protein BKA61DRAFT_580186 [Leptodontidium sp. MPI-SDFR-AT-0119]|nr:hypothetical protein BKA61DRAFT_580186 [Leptodontidium sp. MPI-SDFR-AT-0119]
MEPNGRESHEVRKRHYYVTHTPENGVNQSVWGIPRRQINEQPVTAHPSLYEQALTSAWPLGWSRGTKEGNACLLALSDAQIDNSLKDKYCPCISAFEHENCDCKGKPGQKNFHANWEASMVESGGWVERTKALQNVFEGKGFIEQGEYGAIWDVLHQEPTVMAKFVVKPWKNFEDVWKTFKNKVEEIRNQIAGQIHAIAQVYLSILQVFSTAENQVLIYKALFAPHLVTVMKSAAIMFGRFETRKGALYQPRLEKIDDSGGEEHQVDSMEMEA